MMWEQCVLCVEINHCFYIRFSDVICCVVSSFVANSFVASSLVASSFVANSFVVTW